MCRHPARTALSRMVTPGRALLMLLLAVSHGAAALIPDDPESLVERSLKIAGRIEQGNHIVNEERIDELVGEAEATAGQKLVATAS